MILETRDLNHAIRVNVGTPFPTPGRGAWEIRPADDLSGVVAESESRRASQS